MHGLRAVRRLPARRRPALDSGLGRDLQPAHPTICGRPAGPRPTPPACRSSRVWPATTRWPAGRSTTRCASPRRAPRRATSIPARHEASTCSGAWLPPMGLRVRLKASVNISGLPYQARVVAQALKRYGMILADNGSPWFISGAPDRHWNNDALHLLDRLTGRDFEVVNTSSLPHPPLARSVSRPPPRRPGSVRVGRKRGVPRLIERWTIVRPSRRACAAATDPARPSRTSRCSGSSPSTGSRCPTTSRRCSASTLGTADGAPAQAGHGRLRAQGASAFASNRRCT